MERGLDVVDINVSEEERVETPITRLHTLHETETLIVHQNRGQMTFLVSRGGIE